MGCNSSKTKGPKRGNGRAPPPLPQDPQQQQGPVNQAESAGHEVTSQPDAVPGTAVQRPMVDEATTTHGNPAPETSDGRARSGEAPLQPPTATASAENREVEAAVAKEAAANAEESHSANDDEAEHERHNADGATSTSTSTSSAAEVDNESDVGGTSAAVVATPDPTSITAPGGQQMEAVAGAPAPSSPNEDSDTTTDEFTPVVTEDTAGLPASFSTRHERSSPPPPQQDPLTVATADPDTTADGPAEVTSLSSEVHVEVLYMDNDTAVTDREESPEVAEEEEEEPRPLPQQSASRYAAPLATTPPPPPAKVYEAETPTPVAQDTAPAPTPARPWMGASKPRGSAAPSSSTSAYELQEQQRHHVPASSDARRSTSRPHSVADSLVYPGTYASSQSPSSKQLKKRPRQPINQRPPWQSIVPELDADEDYQYDYKPTASPTPLPAAVTTTTTTKPMTTKPITKTATATTAVTSTITRPPPPRTALQRSATPTEDYGAVAPAHLAAVPPSPSVSSTANAASSEMATHEASVPLPSSTPTERVAARQRRAAMGRTTVPNPPSIEVALHPRSSRGSSATSSYPRQQRRTPAQLAALPPIPYRQGYTDPSPGAAAHAHRPQTTFMPPPTAFVARRAADGSATARALLDPKVAVAAIQTSTTALIQAHNPRMDAAAAAAAAAAKHNEHGGSVTPSHLSVAPSIPASLASRLPVSGADALVYREPVKLAPSYLCDPVYTAEGSVVAEAGPTASAAAAVPTWSTPASATASTYSRNDQLLCSHAVPVLSQQQQQQAPSTQQSTPASRAAPPTSTPASSYRAPTVSDARVRAAARQRVQQAGYGEDVDAASLGFSSYHSAQEVSSRRELVYSSAQEPRERSAVTYEPSIADEAPPTSASVPPATSLRSGAAAKYAAARAKANATVEEDFEDGSAGESAQRYEQHQHERSWSPAEGDGSYDAYDEEEEDDDAAAAAADEAAAAAAGEADAFEYSPERGGSSQPASMELEEASVDEADASEPATLSPVEERVAAASENGTRASEAATATALTAIASADGHVMEHKDPEWRVLQPPPAERKRLLNQAKFVAQMRNVTAV